VALAPRAFYSVCLRNALASRWKNAKYESADLLTAFSEDGDCLATLAEQGRDLVRLVDLAYKLATRLIDLCEKEYDANENELWDRSVLNGSRRTSLSKLADISRKIATDQVKKVRYFYKHAHWLLSRFPEGELRDVIGLVKLTDLKEIAAADWSLTPGRYVGAAPEDSRRLQRQAADVRRACAGRVRAGDATRSVSEAQRIDD